METSIFWPVITLVGLTGCIWVLMYVRRISEIWRARIDPQSLATSDIASNILKDVSAADNFSNLLKITCYGVPLISIPLIPNRIFSPSS